MRKQKIKKQNDKSSTEAEFFRYEIFSNAKANPKKISKIFMSNKIFAKKDFTLPEQKFESEAAWHSNSKREIGADIPKGCRPRFSPTYGTPPTRLREDERGLPKDEKSHRQPLPLSKLYVKVLSKCSNPL
ncbi:MAG: hypothetical protein JWQ35_2740 [Bacteriovoracaceae bacterium]|nr:hypothetical protein [Bacteriovoracaceae bacterium]